MSVVGLDIRDIASNGHIVTSQVKSCDKRVQTPGMSPPRAGAWTGTRMDLLSLHAIGYYILEIVSEDTMSGRVQRKKRSATMNQSIHD